MKLMNKCFFKDIHYFLYIKGHTNIFYTQTASCADLSLTKLHYLLKHVIKQAFLFALFGDKQKVRIFAVCFS
ncbi:conserved domain protein [Bacteroides fluxus YIT 12057]|uniref:Conserved domain protein n=1 Tax=Bacteroides fluxus YIT 12057 TaxID=763034 RepID=F3PVF9_9BACE|nr:conserved domain protein [Bacteroides fluxus YIT 12057]